MNKQVLSSAGGAKARGRVFDVVEGLITRLAYIGLLIAAVAVSRWLGHYGEKPAAPVWNNEPSIHTAALLRDGKTFITGGGKAPGESVTGNEAYGTAK